MPLADDLADTPLRIVHVLLFVAWLGVDVGVFTASWVLRRRGLSGETRLVLTRLLVGLDLAPRISLLLMVPVGLGLAYSSGLGLDELSAGWMRVAFWLSVAAAALWAVALLREHRLTGRGDHGTPFQRRYRVADKSLRAALAAFFLVTGIQSVAGDGIWEAGHVAWKAIVFGLVIVIGEWIDAAFRDFGPALTDLLEHGETPERHARLDRAITAAYPPVLAIYGAVLVLAILGIGRIGR